MMLTFFPFKENKSEVSQNQLTNKITVKEATDVQIASNSGRDTHARNDECPLSN